MMMVEVISVTEGICGQDDIIHIVADILKY